MTPSVRRRSLLSILLLTLVGCSESNDVTVRYETTYGYVRGGRPEKRPPLAEPYVGSILVGDERIEGTFSSPGFSFAGVPRGDFVFRAEFPLVANYPDDRPFVIETHTDSRRLQFGERFWFRGDVELTDETVPVTLEASGLSWREWDNVAVVSSSANTELYVPIDEQPDDGATTASFAFDVRDLTGDARAPLLRADDDLTLVQMRGTTSADFGLSVPPYSPYYGAGGDTAVAKAVVAERWAAGSGATLTASFAPVATTTHTLDVRAESFAALREELGLPDRAQSRISVAVYREPGTDSDYFVGIAPVLVSLESAYVAGAPANPECYPDAEGLCDETLCTSGCDDATSGFLDPADVTLAMRVPSVYDTPGTDVLVFEHRFRSFFQHPVAGTGHYLTATSKVVMLLSNATGPVALTLGPPRNVRIDGQELPWGLPDGTPAPAGTVNGATPTITFEAPNRGNVTRYEVEIVELANATGENGAFRTARNAALIRTTGTSVRVPANVLVPGRYYYVRVIAASDGRTSTDLRIIPRDVPMLETTYATGAFLSAQ
jgi:hypothetical protein